MERGWLTRAGQAAMERLDLPGDIPAGVPHMELIGEREFFMCRHRGVLSYSTETVEIGGGSLTVRVIGTELQLVAMTEEELRLRRRYVLLAAALLTVLLVVEGNFTIWEFQVSGNETVPDEAVLRALEDYGITIGTRSLDIDQKDMRNHVLLELEDVVWLAVNVRGCVARVQVVERVRGQDMVEDGPANVVARRPGLVTRVEALGGQAAVVPGDTVTQGQLLISGAVDLDNGGLRWQHGMGRVWARTWYELTAQVPLTVRQRGVPLSSRTRYALDIGKKRIKLYGKGSTLGGDCDKITQYRPVCLPWGLRLPITVAAETVTAYGPSTDVPRSAGEARQEGEALLRRQLEELLGDTGTAENVRIDAVEQGSWLLVTLRAECLEEIGREVPLTKE